MTISRPIEGIIKVDTYDQNHTLGWAIFYPDKDGFLKMLVVTEDPQSTNTSVIAPIKWRHACENDCASHLAQAPYFSLNLNQNYEVIRTDIVVCYMTDPESFETVNINEGWFPHLNQMTIEKKKEVLKLLEDFSKKKIHYTFL